MLVSTIFFRRRCQWPRVCLSGAGSLIGLFWQDVYDTTPCGRQFQKKHAGIRGIRSASSRGLTHTQVPLAVWGIIITLPAGDFNWVILGKIDAKDCGTLGDDSIIRPSGSSFAGSGGVPCAAQTPAKGFAEIQVADEQPSFFMQIVSNLFNSRGLMETLQNPRYTLAAFIALNVIVFIETGIFFFLPGDSLLVTAGVACWMAGWNLPLLLVTLCLSAIAGDSVGYAIGRKTGPRFSRARKSWLFNKEHLLEAHAFYEKHGGKTIVLARFMPIIRTFAPVIAGVAKMDYRKFLFFNVIGGVSWVVSMTLIGYCLSDLINPTFQNLFGIPDFNVQNHIERWSFSWFCCRLRRG